MFGRNKRHKEDVGGLIEPKKDEPGKDVVKEAEKAAFALVDPNNPNIFTDAQFMQFREKYRLITNPKVRGDLIVQLLEKLDFHPTVHRLRVGSPVRSSSLYQDFVLRVIGNSAADICRHKLDKFENLALLRGYLNDTLRGTFLNKLEDFTKTLWNSSSLDSDDDGTTPTLDVPDQNEELLNPEFDELRDLIRKVIKDLVKELDHAQEWRRYELLYARAVEKKEFREIAQEFNELYNDTLGVDAYRYRYNNTVAALKTSGLLNGLSDDIRLLSDQLSSVPKYVDPLRSKSNPESE